jgi:hypothetical protein
MMRFVIAVLLVLNLATLAWQWDAFARWGWGPHSAREPERVLNQLRPEALKAETPAAFKQRKAADAASEEASQGAASDSAPASVAPDATASKPAAASKAPASPSP